MILYHYVNNNICKAKSIYSDLDWLIINCFHELIYNEKDCIMAVAFLTIKICHYITKSINKFLQQKIRIGKNYKLLKNLYQTIFKAKYALYFFIKSFISWRYQLIMLLGYIFLYFFNTKIAYQQILVMPTNKFYIDNFQNIKKALIV